MRLIRDSAMGVVAGKNQSAVWRRMVIRSAAMAVVIALFGQSDVGIASTELADRAGFCDRDVGSDMMRDGYGVASAGWRIAAHISTGKRYRRRKRSLLNCDPTANLKTDASIDGYLANTHSDLLVVQVGHAIHDGPIQILTIANINLDHLLKELAPITAHQETIISAARTLITQAIGELRDIAIGSIVPRLQGLNAEGAIRLAIRDHEAATNRTVKYEYEDLAFEPTPLMRLCMFQIVQECLNNSFRYAQGDEHGVKATLKVGWICILIEDGGIGDVNARSNCPGTGIGLLGLRRQVETLGGHFTIDISRHRTTVCATFPFSNDATRNCTAI
jgi:hypothetical protein